MGHIAIRELKIFAHHGVFAEETENGQYFFIDADLFVDTWEAEHTDDLRASVHYGEVSLFIQEVFTRENHLLIERAASVLAEEVITRFNKIDAVKIRIYKPSAPIPMDFKTVFVESERRWHTAFIATGSNMGDSRKNIADAVKMLGETEGVEIVKESELIVTKPYGYLDQDDFVNGCVQIRTWLPPLVLLHRMQEIEQALHRERLIHWGPRTLDLDLLFYDQEIISHPELVVPHPDMKNREFVLEPMNNVAPWWMHPVTHQTMAQMLKVLREKNV